MAEPFDMGPEFLGRIPLFAELQRLLSWSGGPINWELAGQLAAATATSKQGAGAKAVDEQAASEANRHASLLVGSVLEVSPTEAELLGPVAFAARIVVDGRELFEAVARRASAGLNEGVALPEGFAEGLPDGLADAMQGLGPMLHGAQTGSTIGETAGSVVGWCDLGLPVETTSPVLVPVVVGRLTREYEMDERAALLASILRATVDHAVTATFAGVRGRFLSAYLDLVATLEHDASNLGEQLRGLDPSDPSSLQRLMEGGFGFERSPASETASQFVDALCALHVAAVDRFVLACAAKAGIDHRVVDACGSRRTDASVEALRSLLGLGAVPTSAAAFVDAIVVQGGFDLLRVALGDPADVPSPTELTDPAAWIARVRP